MATAGQDPVRRSLPAAAGRREHHAPGDPQRDPDRRPRGKRENGEGTLTRLDQPAVPGAQFQVFHLQSRRGGRRRETTIQNAFHRSRRPLSPAVRVTADPRTNSLIVQASPRDMAEVAELIRQIDVAGSDKGRSTRCGSSSWSIRWPRTSPRSCNQAIGLSAGTDQGTAPRRQAGQQGGQPGCRAGQAEPGGQPPGQGQTTPAARAAAGKRRSGPPCSAFSRSTPKAAGC